MVTNKATPSGSPWRTMISLTCLGEAPDLHLMQASLSLTPMPTPSLSLKDSSRPQEAWPSQLWKQVKTHSSSTCQKWAKWRVQMVRSTLPPESLPKRDSSPNCHSLWNHATSKTVWQCLWWRPLRCSSPQTTLLMTRFKRISWSFTDFAWLNAASQRTSWNWWLP